MPQSTAQRSQSPEDRQQATGAAKKPVEKFNDGPIHVSIWQNEGTKGAFFSASIELRYTDNNEEWQTGHSYTSFDLRHLETAAREARTRMNVLRARNAATLTSSPGVSSLRSSGSSHSAEEP